MAKKRSSGKGRGWNFKKGAPNAITAKEARERASVGGQAKVATKGFGNERVMRKALQSRGIETSER